MSLDTYRVALEVAMFATLRMVAIDMLHSQLMTRRFSLRYLTVTRV